jgi:inosose dehydratase
MAERLTRRAFLAGAAALAAGRALGAAGEVFGAEPARYPEPEIDLSRFDTPIPRGPFEVRFGYAAITWGGNDRQAIDEIAEVGFRGIQLRANVLQTFGERPGELADLLRARNLTFVALSSGSVRLEGEAEAAQIDRHVAHARFLRSAGGLYLQVTDARPKGRTVGPADYERLGRLLTEIGRRTADLGIPLGYHNHMDSLGERPEEVDAVLAASDPRYVRLELDVAHYVQGGGDPAAAIERHAERLLFLHVKDVESPVPGDPSRPYRFVELGRGRVDLPGVFAALERVRFRGWAIVELDAVPVPGRTPKESAIINRRYLEEVLKLKV